MNVMSKTLAAGLACLALVGTVLAAPSPAAAQWVHQGWGPHPGPWRVPGWRPGSAPHPGWVWRAGYWRGGVWYNGWWAAPVVAGVAAGVAAGAIIAAAPPPAPGCWQYRPVYDAYGHWLGNRTVNVCR